MNKKGQELFTFLKDGDLDSAQKILDSSLYLSEDLMDKMSAGDYKPLEKHWSAVNCGEMISTPLKQVIKLSRLINFQEKSTLIDLGSGHGYPAIVFALLNSSLKVSGFDIVEAKVKGSQVLAKDLGLEGRLHFECKNLEDFKIPSANYYYIYNPFSSDVMAKVAYRLKAIKESGQRFQIIAAGEKTLEHLKSSGFKTFRTKLAEDFYLFS